MSPRARGVRGAREVNMRGTPGWVGLVLLVGVGGCDAGVTGMWIGTLNCEGLANGMELLVERESGLDYVGEGSQRREFTNTDGVRTTLDIEFDAEITLRERSGPQDLRVRLRCTDEQLLEHPGGTAPPRVMRDECTPNRYADWVLAWDGDSRMTIATPEACTGAMTRRSGR